MLVSISLWIAWYVGLVSSTLSLIIWIIYERYRWSTIRRDLTTLQKTCQSEYKVSPHAIQTIIEHDIQMVRYIINPKYVEQIYRLQSSRMFNSTDKKLRLSKMIHPSLDHLKKQIAKLFVGALPTEITTTCESIWSAFDREVLVFIHGSSNDTAVAQPLLSPPPPSPSSKQKKTTAYETVLLDNDPNQSLYRLHVMWTPVVCDWLMKYYQHGCESMLRKAGFRKQLFCDTNIKNNTKKKQSQISIWIRKVSTCKNPILVLHGICPVVPWMGDFAQHNPNRTILLPIHPALNYDDTSMTETNSISTIHYARQLTRFLHAHVMGREESIDVVAWSFGGLVRNYIFYCWNELKQQGSFREKPQQRRPYEARQIIITTNQKKEDTDEKKKKIYSPFNREVMVEPMGLTVSSVVAASYCMLTMKQALKRARDIAPLSQWWDNFLVFIFLRYHIHMRPVHMDRFWNIECCLYYPTSWNKPRMTICLSRDDTLIPSRIATQHMTKYMPDTPPARVLPGPHGSWPRHDSFLPLVTHCLNH